MTIFVGVCLSSGHLHAEEVRQVEAALALSGVRCFSRSQLAQQLTILGRETLAVRVAVDVLSGEHEVALLIRSHEQLLGERHIDTKGMDCQQKLEAVAVVLAISLDAIEARLADATTDVSPEPDNLDAAPLPTGAARPGAARPDVARPDVAPLPTGAAQPGAAQPRVLENTGPPPSTLPPGNPRKRERAAKSEEANVLRASQPLASSVPASSWGRLRAEGEALALYNVLAGWSAAAEVALSVGLARGLAIRAGGFAALPSVSKLGGGEVRSTLLAGRLDACGVGLDGRFGTRACLGAMGGRLAASGMGFQRSHSVQLPWVALVARLEGQLVVHRSVHLALAVNAYIPLVEVQLERRTRAGVEVAEASPVGLGLAFGVHFGRW